MNAIDRLCTIATDVSLEATTLAADVRDELAHMRSAIGKALADMKDVDEPCDGGSWCFVHDDHVPIDSEHCHTHQGHLRLQALISSALPSPSVEREAPAPELTADGGSGAGGAHEFHSEPWTAPGYASKCSCGWDALPGHRFSIVDAKALHREHLASLAP